MLFFQRVGWVSGPGLGWAQYGPPSRTVPFFSPQLFSSMSAAFTLNFFRSGINFNKWGSFQLPGLLNFGEFKVTPVSPKGVGGG